MKLLKLIPVLLLALLFTNCSEPSGFYEDIIEIYFDPANPETLVVSTSMLTNNSDYIIPNDGTSEFTIQMVETDTEIEFDFKAASYVDRLSLLQYKHDATTEEVPFKEIGKNHFHLKKPSSSFYVPATGIYKFTVIRYNQCKHCW